MPRVCTICNHPDRRAMDKELVAGSALPAIAALYRVSPDALLRHKGKHLPRLLVKAQATEEVAYADTLLEQVRSLQVKALAILDKAEEGGDLRAALGAIREARGNLELLAKLLGELDERPTVNLMVSPAWLRVRGILLTTLAPYAEARAAVAQALAGVESELSA